jgi:hypothetical protein
VDAHTKDNRDKRKALQERRNGLSKQMEFLGQTIQEGNSKVNNLYAGIETNLALAKHAETWEWKEVNPIRGVSRMPTFEEVWDDIQRRLPIGIDMRYQIGAMTVASLSRWCSPRRFPPPWSVEETDACFIVKDRASMSLA